MVVDVTNDKQWDSVPEFIPWARNIACKVINGKNDNSRKFDLDEQQINLLKSLHENKHNIIKSYRRSGLSMFMIINSIYNILYNTYDRPYNCLYICNSSVSADYEMRYFLQILELCDETVYLTEKKPFSVELRFRHKTCCITFFSQNRTRKHSELGFYIDCKYSCPGYHEVNIDNAAFITDSDTISDIKEVIKTGEGKVNIGSSPRNNTGFFYDTWKESVKGESVFTPIPLKWYLDSRFNSGLKACKKSEKYPVNNIVIMLDALENGYQLTNEWHEEKKDMLGDSYITEIDGGFVNQEMEK